MAAAKFPYQPTLRHLLSCEAMSEAQVLFGQELLDRPVAQVVTSLQPPLRAGSLVVTRAGSLGSQDGAALVGLSGVAVIKPYVVPGPAGLAVPDGQSSATAVPASFALDADLARLVRQCTDAGVPVIVIPGFGDASQSADDVRQAFLAELKRAASRIHAHLIALAISEGLNGLIEELFSWVNRPLAVESADFKILAAKNMGPTPASQQRVLTEQLAAEVNRQLRSQEHYGLPEFALRPLKLGRRLIFPIVLDEVVVGYLSAMVRPTDDADMMAEYLGPAALACMVDFSQRRKDVSTFTATQQSLLKDFLSGRSLSAPDQERLERHFGFDLCDELLVCAVQAVAEPNEQAPAISSLDGRYVTTEIEGACVFVLPFDRKSGRTWQQEAEEVTTRIKSKAPAIKLQVGVGRITETTLDLPDSYREARQALIIGSMLHGEGEFQVAYGDLGIKRLLYLLFDHPELDRFYAETLEPLEAYDAEWESELVPTLAVYLKEGANLNSAARALFIHRHTLRYRLEQIADILKVDIDSQEVLLNLQIAFIIKDMRGKAQD